MKLAVGDTIERSGDASSRYICIAVASGSNPKLTFRQMGKRGRIINVDEDHLSSSVEKICFETFCLLSNIKYRRVYLRPDLGDLPMTLEKMDPILLPPGNNGTSIDVRQQGQGTCYAHACADVIHAAESRIVGGNPEFLQTAGSLANDIIDEFGTDGCSYEKVLKSWCRKKKLQFKEIGSPDEVLNVVRSGRPVLTSFVLKLFEWECFHTFYKTNPKGVLKDVHFNNWVNLIPDYDTFRGHAVVITACHVRSSNGMIVFRIKNSWGRDFANDGYFRVQANAFPQGITKFYDVFSDVDDLSAENLQDCHNSRKREVIEIDN